MLRAHLAVLFHELLVVPLDAGQDLLVPLLRLLQDIIARQFILLLVLPQPFQLELSDLVGLLVDVQYLQEILVARLQVAGLLELLVLFRGQAQKSSVTFSPANPDAHISIHMHTHKHTRAHM